jgi:hypothetical protein
MHSTRSHSRLSFALPVFLVDTQLHFFSEVRFLIFLSEWNAYGTLGHEYTFLSIGGLMLIDTHSLHDCPHAYSHATWYVTPGVPGNPVVGVRFWLRFLFIHGGHPECDHEHSRNEHKHGYQPRRGHENRERQPERKHPPRRARPRTGLRHERQRRCQQANATSKCATACYQCGNAESSVSARWHVVWKYRGRRGSPAILDEQGVIEGGRWHPYAAPALILPCSIKNELYTAILPV